jgi:hypothetical protein
MTPCPKCGKTGKIVNACRCDPNNLPTRPVYASEEARIARLKEVGMYANSMAEVRRIAEAVS